MSDYRITIRVRNARILRAMESAGIRTVRELALACAISEKTLGSIVNLTWAARDRDGEWRWQVVAMAAALGTHPETLFSDAQAKSSLPTNVRSIDADESDVKAAIESFSQSQPSLDDVVGDRQQLSILLSVLPAKERDMVERHHLAGETLDEVGASYGLTREGARQVILRAFRLMRRPVVMAWVGHKRIAA